MSKQPEEPRAAGPFETAVHALTGWLGSTASIALAVAMVGAWALARPLFASREDWVDTLVIALAALSFLLMLLLQRSQNKDTLALQLKLNELIASQHGASNRLIDLENLSEADARKLHRHYQRLAKHTKGEDDLTAPHTVEESAGGRNVKS
jgi:low affinity Fe/Cu permease